MRPTDPVLPAAPVTNIDRLSIIIRSPSHSLSTFYVQLAWFGGFFGRLSFMSRHNVGGVPR
jgi:hypothetical protein